MAEAADDPDWLALQAAGARSPFKMFQKPDAPFEAYAIPQTAHEQFGAHAQPNPHPDLEYSTKNIKDIKEHQQRPNALKSAFAWLKGIIPHGHETADRQSLPEAMANPRTVGVAERLRDAPARALNLAAGMADAIAGSGQETSEAFGHAMRGENRPGTGFAGTGMTEPTMLVPAQAAAGFIPGLSRLARVGEASPISTYDKVRAKLEESPLFNWERPGVLGDRGLPLPGAPTLPSIWPGPEFLPETGPAWKHQANPFSEEAGRIRGHLKSLGQETWPKAPPFEDTSPLGPNGSKSMNAEMGRPGNERQIGAVKPGYWEALENQQWQQELQRNPTEANKLVDEVTRGRGPFDGPATLKAEGDAKLAPFARRTEPLPLTESVRLWLKGATGQRPNVRVAAGKDATDYVKVPAQADLPDIPGVGRGQIEVRIPQDNHTGSPRPGVLDTAGGKDRRVDHYATNGLNRFNAAGEPYSKIENLIESLKWATSSSPGGGNWLVAPGKEPRWARYAKEEPAPKPTEGADFSPEQLKLLGKAGEEKMTPFAAEQQEKPIRAYHGSTKEGGFQKFKRKLNDIGVHFGTAEQANNRLDYITTREGSKRSMDGSHVVPVDLNIKNPLRLPDLGAWDADNLSWGLLKAVDTDPAFGRRVSKEDINAAMRSARTSTGQVAALRDLISRKGYDGIVYKNDGEVAGAQPYQRAQDAAYAAVQEAARRGELPKNGFTEKDRQHPAYQAWSKAMQDSLEFRTKNAEDSYIATKKGTVRSALTGDVLFTRGGDLKTMLAAARGDPDKLASIRKTIESLKGVSPGGIAKVLETQHGLDVHPGDVPQVLRELDRNRFPMPNQSQPSLQSRIDKAYEHTRPGPRSIRSEPGFPQRFWEAWDRHQGHQQKVADELGVSQSTVYAWKNQIPRPAPQTAEGAAAEAARFSAQRAEVGKRTLDAGNRYRGGRSFMNEGKRELTPQEPLLGKKAPSRVQAVREQRSQGEASEAELAKRGGKPFWDETGRAAAAESDMKAVRELFGKKPDDTTLFARGPTTSPLVLEALRLHHEEGMSLKDAGAKMGVDPNTLYTARKRGRQQGIPIPHGLKGRAGLLERMGDKWKPFKKGSNTHEPDTGGD